MYQRASTNGLSRRGPTLVLVLELTLELMFERELELTTALLEERELEVTVTALLLDGTTALLELRELEVTTTLLEVTVTLLEVMVLLELRELEVLGPLSDVVNEDATELGRALLDGAEVELLLPTMP